MAGMQLTRSNGPIAMGLGSCLRSVIATWAWTACSACPKCAWSTQHSHPVLPPFATFRARNLAAGCPHRLLLRKLELIGIHRRQAVIGPRLGRRLLGHPGGHRSGPVHAPAQVHEAPFLPRQITFPCRTCLAHSAREESPYSVSIHQSSRWACPIAGSGWTVSVLALELHTASSLGRSRHF